MSGAEPSRSRSSVANGGFIHAVTHGTLAPTVSASIVRCTRRGAERAKTRPGEREKRLARIPVDCEKLSLVFSPAPGRRVGCSLRELVKVDGSRLIAPVADTIIRDTDRETDMYTPGFGQGNLQEDENM